MTLLARIHRLAVLFGVVGLFTSAQLAAAAGSRLNVLFIAVDDLRPELGCYGVKGIHTPNLDGLAKRGLLFNRAYCQQAVCSPSRTSLLTGRRPDTTRIFNLQDHFRDTIPDVVTLPQHFKNNGYFCQSFGKIYHGGLDDPKSWSAPSFWASLNLEMVAADGTRRKISDPDDLLPDEGSSTGVFPLGLYPIKNGNPFASAPWMRVANKTGPHGKAKRNAEAKADAKGSRQPWSSPDVGDSDLPDGEIADKAIKVMEERKEGPFFLAVGFHKPHLSFDAPKKYYDLYKLEDMKLASNPSPPKDVFPPAMSDWGELRGYKGMPKEGPVSEQQARELIRGYYAATSYTDAQIGRVLAALDRLGLRDNTIIIIWGDHGWQLGEHGMWCKHTNYETSTHAMLMLSVPKQKHRGAKTDALVEFVDIYPTLCELAGLPLLDGLEGTSFAPLLANPSQTWKSAAFSQYPRGKLMGHAMRTDRYRYVEWAEKGKAPEGVELYDHKTDPEENVNVANRPENKELITRLSAQLQAGWMVAKPKAN